MRVAARGLAGLTGIPDNGDEISYGIVYGHSKKGSR
tara:strand:+ start:42 stop:149 length:108 start_codon:yes stop_codon:yes gene_type:complete